MEGCEGGRGRRSHRSGFGEMRSGEKVHLKFKQEHKRILKWVFPTVAHRNTRGSNPEDSRLVFFLRALKKQKERKRRFPSLEKDKER